MNSFIKLLLWGVFITSTISLYSGNSAIKAYSRNLSGQSNDSLFRRPLIEQEILSEKIHLVKADPEKGFNFDYFLFIPKGFDLTKETFLLVESTNSGLSDSMAHHIEGAKHAASQSSVGNFVSRKLKIPLLVPVFPRSETNWKMYTHAFDSETFNEKASELERLDLQLLAMVEDAKLYFNENGIKIHNRFFMAGFSASGTFANRFSMLHPEKIKAVCAGGLNSILILPLEESEGETLNFPIGIADVENVTGNKINMASFRKLPQFWFMGAEDNNDAAKFDDGYNPDERKLIFKLLGENMMPERWENVQGIYKTTNIHARFETYEGVGHGTDLKINNDISSFFEKHLE